AKENLKKTIRSKRKETKSSSSSRSSISNTELIEAGPKVEEEVATTKPFLGSTDLDQDSSSFDVKTEKYNNDIHSDSVGSDQIRSENSLAPIFVSTIRPDFQVKSSELNLRYGPSGRGVYDSLDYAILIFKYRGEYDGLDYDTLIF
ncbi:uncharacterized protein LOC111695027, partial [Eurytemora carolleeae]|uniref:uncharacterized protein LOC111695027 n=1 Tax=Eurytemora carolleeae TaxID=1294199 RepID=UPI000C77B1D4